MKIFVAIVSSLFIFLLVWFLSSMLIAVLWNYSQKQVVIGSLVTDISSLIGLALAGLAATQTFKASLKAKTGRLYRRKKE